MTKDLRIGFGIFAAWIILGAYEPEIAGILIGVPMIVFGFVGIARRRITMRGPGGPYRTYVGSDAVFPSLFFVLIGGGFSMVAAFHRWPSLLTYFGG